MYLNHFKLNSSKSFTKKLKKLIENKRLELAVLNKFNNQGKNYLKTNYLAENEGGNLISKMIEINREDVVGLVIDHDLNVLMQVDEFDKHKRNVLMIAIDKLNEGLAKLIMHKIPEDTLGKVLTQVDKLSKKNALMMALYKGDEELAKLIIDKTPKGKLEEVLTQVDMDGNNALMIASGRGIALSVLCPQGIIERLQMEL